MILIFTLQKRCILQQMTKGMNKDKVWGETAKKLGMPGIYRIPVHSTINLYFRVVLKSPLQRWRVYLNVLFNRRIKFLFFGDTEVIYSFLQYSLVYYIHWKTYLFRTSFWFNRKMLLATAMWNTHFSPCVDFWHINARSLCSLSLSRKTCLRLISSSSLPFKVAVFQCHLKTELW